MFRLPKKCRDRLVLSSNNWSRSPPCNKNLFSKLNTNMSLQTVHSLKEHYVNDIWADLDSDDGDDIVFSVLNLNHDRFLAEFDTRSRSSIDISPDNLSPCLEVNELRRTSSTLQLHGHPIRRGSEAGAKKLKSSHRLCSGSGDFSASLNKNKQKDECRSDVLIEKCTEGWLQNKLQIKKSRKLSGIGDQVFIDKHRQTRVHKLRNDANRSSTFTTSKLRSSISELNHRKGYKRIFLKLEDAAKAGSSALLITAATVIQSAWRSLAYRRAFLHVRELLRHYTTMSPVAVLRAVNPREASLLDAASGSHVHFRLASDPRVDSSASSLAPPVVVYKIYTWWPVVDVGAVVPGRHGAGGSDTAFSRWPVMKGPYARVENNNWRVLADLAACRKHRRLNHRLKTDSSSRSGYRNKRPLPRACASDSGRENKIAALRRLYGFDSGFTRQGAAPCYEPLDSERYAPPPCNSFISSIDGDSKASEETTEQSRRTRVASFLPISRSRWTQKSPSNVQPLLR